METETYTPELMPRRGEWTAWGLAFFSLLGLVFLDLSGFSSWIANFFVGFLFFAAASISLGNWVDRRTELRQDEAGIFFSNGLRKVRLEWTQIQEVRVFPGQNGDTVQVIGAAGHFAFKTLGEMKYAGETRVRTGFVDGARLLAGVVARAGLREVERTSSFTRYARP